MFQARFNSALQLFTAGDNAGAERACRQLLVEFPERVEARAMLGHLLQRTARDTEASSVLEKAVAMEPRLQRAWKDLAIIALRQGQAETALRAARRALDLLPNDAWARFMVGHALFLGGKRDQAEGFFAQAQQQLPQLIEARLELATVALSRNELDDAAIHARASLLVRPNWGLAHALLGDAQFRRNQRAAALESLRTAYRLEPANPVIVKGYATVLQRMRSDPGTLIELRKILLAQQPDSLDAREDLATAYVCEAHYDLAIAEYDRVSEGDPMRLLPRWVKFQCPSFPYFRSAAERAQFVPDWDIGMRWFEALDFSRPDMPRQARSVLGSVTSFHLAYTGEALRDYHVRNASMIRRLIDVGSSGVGDVATRRIGSKRRRIGIISASLHWHSVTRVWGEALLSLPREDFELFVLHVEPRQDAMVARFRERADCYVAAPPDFNSLTSTLREAELDIALFLEIGMDSATQALATIRYAPVQCTTWAHPITSGMASMDYFLSADLAEPANAQEHYAERLLRLPNLGGSFLPLGAPAAPPSLVNKDCHVICVQSISKLHPEHDTLFARIASGAPNTRFSLLTAGWAHQVRGLSERLFATLDRHQIDRNRFQIHGKLPLDEYQQRLASADVALDTLDFSGGLTTLDALESDLPVVTLPGKLMRGRQSYAMLKRIELGDLIAGDIDDYVRIATKLATERDFRMDVRTQISTRKQVLFNDQSIAPALAELLRTIEAPE